MHRILLILFILASTFSLVSRAQEPLELSKSELDSINDVDAFLELVNNTLHEYYMENTSTKQQVDSIISAFGYDEKDVPEISDSVYKLRLDELSKLGPLTFDFNEPVANTLKFFNQKRRGFTSIVLGRSKLYFPMYEEKLAQHDMPLELKYLSVIESGLRPQVKSRAGALGLWQFMFRTGKMYGLDQTSYIDERMDPELATEAACRYLKKLYSLYDDWWMALAAYNAGPGNVNKAIRRSGGKMTYWEIRPFLPKETQGYVPNFIAMAYLITYHAEHNIMEREANFHDFQIDTVCLKQGLHMEVIDSLIGWKVADIQQLNPIYKTTYIPYIERHRCINIPTKYMNDWLAVEDTIYKVDSLMYYKMVEEKIIEEQAATTSTIHYVKSGQTLSYIASKYGTTVNKLMEWNNLRSTKLAIGQKIIIYKKTPIVATKPAEPPKEEAKSQPEVKQEIVIPEKTEEKTHTIVAGESLWAIANQADTTVEELLKLNPGIDHKDLKVGQVIRIR